MFDDQRYLRHIEWKDREEIDFKSFPYFLEVFKGFEKLELDPAVTFLVGENGSGKSTLIEGLAVALGFNAEGGTRNSSFSTCDTHSDLGEHLKIIKGRQQPRDGYFLRAESFYNVATYSDEINRGHSDVTLHEQSHGESFLNIFERFRGHGIYLMDEPEAALSPTRQMTAISLIHDLVEHQSQLIIATHSPILLAYPKATIYELSEEGIQKVTYEETEVYKTTKDFLNRHQQMIRFLTE